MLPNSWNENDDDDVSETDKNTVLAEREMWHDHQYLRRESKLKVEGENEEEDGRGEQWCETVRRWGQDAQKRGLHYIFWNTFTEKLWKDVNK